MLFSNITFLFYFLPAFLLLYYLTPVKFRNYSLLLGSIVFYSWGGPVFIFVILCTTAIDYILVKQIEKAITKTRKKQFLYLSLLLNLGILFCFKYLQFFVENVNTFLGWANITGISIPDIVLPIGISFFTFESLTYVIDVYRGEQRTLSRFVNYLTYILMFPKLIAGPIIPYNKIGSQIEAERKVLAADRLKGFMRFIFGLSKKVLIANILGETVDHIYKNDLANMDSSLAWIVSIAYTMQLYFDFSGYSDMAIGLGQMLGFKIPENFNFPYISRSITEFWKRWHISLGNWMRNYLYIPLGGNRAGKYATYINLWIVFLISGFWHGAGWNYIIWGAFHGLFLVMERLFLQKYLKNGVGLLYVFFVANIGWVFFKNEDLNTAFQILQHMFSFQFTNSFSLEPRFVFVLLLALIFAFMGAIKPVEEQIQNEDLLFFKNWFRLATVYTICVVCFLLSASYLLAEGFNPFIYFRF